MRGQSFGAYQVRDGSQTAMPIRTAYKDSNVQEQIRVPDLAKHSRTRLSENPSRKRSPEN